MTCGRFKDGHPRRKTCKTVFRKNKCQAQTACRCCQYEPSQPRQALMFVLVFLNQFVTILLRDSATNLLGLQHLFRQRKFESRCDLSRNLTRNILYVNDVGQINVSTKIYTKVRQLTPQVLDVNVSRSMPEVQTPFLTLVLIHNTRYIWRVYNILYKAETLR